MGLRGHADHGKSPFSTPVYSLRENQDPSLLCFLIGHLPCTRHLSPACSDVATRSHLISAQGFHLLCCTCLHLTTPLSNRTGRGAQLEDHTAWTLGPQPGPAGFHPPWCCSFSAVLLYYSCCSIPSSSIKSSVLSLNQLSHTDSLFCLSIRSVARAIPVLCGPPTTTTTTTKNQENVPGK